jgi:hypothetical protein
MDTPAKNRRLLLGARAIARHALGDDGRTSSVYEAIANGELPIFKLNGRLAAFSDTLDAAMLAKEKAAFEIYERRRQVLAERIAAKAQRAWPRSRVAGDDFGHGDERCS